MAHLTRSRRDQLEALHRARHSQQEIAGILDCSQATVSRELARGSPGLRQHYSARKAQERADARRCRSCDTREYWHDDARLLVHVETALLGGKSPDQIAGRMLRQDRQHRVSHQSIYTYIARDKEAGGMLYTLLRYQGRKYQWRGMAKKKTKIPDRKGIEERSEVVNEKKRSGDWESDLVVSGRSGKGAVATFVERTCMYFKAVLVADKSADEMVRASSRALQRIPATLRLTMTHDNGSEISKHAEITDNLQMPVYCARPYKSCDRGLNEFMNRELRRFFPKGTDFSCKTQKDIDAAVKWLNNCPRRSLQYRTPQEMFQEQKRIMRFTR